MNNYLIALFLLQLSTFVYFHFKYSNLKVDIYIERNKNQHTRINLLDLSSKMSTCFDHYAQQFNKVDAEVEEQRKQISEILVCIEDKQDGFQNESAKKKK